MRENYYLIVVFVVNIGLKTVSAGVLHDLIDVKGNHGIREVRILYYEQQLSIPQIPTVYPLIRGVPMYAEVDFVPRYIPQLTHFVSVSVLLPEKIRNKQWYIGFHQEIFNCPKCRLCTNTNQSYTIPVTIYLPDDGWCAQGRVPTIWKVEALPLNPTDNDQTDMILGFAYDSKQQIRIVNNNQSIYCKDRNEVIISD